MYFLEGGRKKFGHCFLETEKNPVNREQAGGARFPVADVSNIEELYGVWKVPYSSRLCYHKMGDPSKAQTIYTTQGLATITM